MESKPNQFIWKTTMNDGSMPIRRFGDASQENTSKSMKTAPNLSKNTLIADGFIKNIKKISKLVYVDEKTKKRFKDEQIVYCNSLQCYVQIKSFEPSQLVYKCKMLGTSGDAE